MCGSGGFLAPNTQATASCTRLVYPTEKQTVSSNYILKDMIFLALPCSFFFHVIGLSLYEVCLNTVYVMLGD